MSQNKKAITMMISLLSIVVFSYVVILGLRISANQVASIKSLNAFKQSQILLEDLSALVPQIIQQRKQQNPCMRHLNLKYPPFDLKTHIIYEPSCTKEALDNKSKILDLTLDIKIINTQNDITLTKMQHYKLH